MRTARTPAVVSLVSLVVLAACPPSVPADEDVAGPGASPAKTPAAAVDRAKEHPLPNADIPRRNGPIALDGVADEPDWQSAPVFAFHPYDGKAKITRATRARMLWDDAALYVSFDVDDPDTITPYSMRDDPLYDSEATELFIDADGDMDVYVELQSDSSDLHFDAAFAGGARKNMDKAWDSPFETKTKKSETGYTSEWRIPVASLKDIPAGEPKAGAAWKVNFFRLERIRASKDLDAKITRTEASAWSPPLTGDFHTLKRFGTITFKE